MTPTPADLAAIDLEAIRIVNSLRILATTDSESDPDKNEEYP